MLLWKRVTDLEIVRSLIRKDRRFVIPADGGKAGTGTTGWVRATGATGGSDLVAITLAASLTDCKWNLPLRELVIGDRIRGVYLVGQVESAGNNVVINVDLRRMQYGTTDNADGSIKDRTLTTITADARLDESNSMVIVDDKGVLVQNGDLFYVCVKATTGALTDISLLGVVVVVDQA